MVSLRETSLKYRGQKAKTYDAVRTKQARWKLENETVEDWIEKLKPRTVLDCPVGTGRFFPYYSANGVICRGVDISQEMLDLAAKKVSRGKKSQVLLKQGLATELDEKDRSHDMVICARFLDLIDEEAMQKVVREMTRVAKRHFIAFIRLGDKYVPKSNTSTHDKKKFTALVGRCGFRVAETVLFRGGDWHILLMERK